MLSRNLLIFSALVLMVTTVGTAPVEEKETEEVENDEVEEIEIEIEGISEEEEGAGSQQATTASKDKGKGSHQESSSETEPNGNKQTSISTTQPDSPSSASEVSGTNGRGGSVQTDTPVDTTAKDTSVQLGSTTETSSSGRGDHGSPGSQTLHSTGAEGATSETASHSAGGQQGGATDTISAGDPTVLEHHGSSSQADTNGPAGGATDIQDTSSQLAAPVGPEASPDSSPQTESNGNGNKHMPGSHTEPTGADHHQSSSSHTDSAGTLDQGGASSHTDLTGRGDQSSVDHHMQSTGAPDLTGTNSQTPPTGDPSVSSLATDHSAVVDHLETTSHTSESTGTGDQSSSSTQTGSTDAGAGDHADTRLPEGTTDLGVQSPTSSQTVQSVDHTEGGVDPGSTDSADSNGNGGRQSPVSQTVSPGDQTGTISHTNLPNVMLAGTGAGDLQGTDLHTQVMGGGDQNGVIFHTDITAGTGEGHGLSQNTDLTGHLHSSVSPDPVGVAGVAVTSMHMDSTAGGDHPGASTHTHSAGVVDQHSSVIHTESPFTGDPLVSMAQSDSTVTANPRDIHDRLSNPGTTSATEPAVSVGEQYITSGQGPEGTQNVELEDTC
ncbi:mucin-21 isoform X3 [Amia ocellicauda]|uniref:mucin-21 isoform X3 n=1 Tax=Amia ocellicauda TaxID=2972642 RepID=UPI003463B4A8